MPGRADSMRTEKAPFDQRVPPKASNPPETVVDGWVEEESPEGRPASRSSPVRVLPLLLIILALITLLAIVVGVLTSWINALAVFVVGCALGFGANPEVWALVLRWKERSDLIHEHEPPRRIE